MITSLFKIALRYLSIAILLVVFIPEWGFSLWDRAHKNTAEDAIVYMEKKGTNQQRWVADYLKAKVGGRTTGSTFGNFAGDGKTEGNEEGFIGIARAGAIAPDYAHDLWWDDTTTWNWGIDIPTMGMTNFSSWTHFMNFNRNSDDGTIVKTNNYNDFDGWSYNASYGFPSMGIDYAIASFMNDAWMTINLANCSDCSDKYSFVPDGNPAVDYKQNGSATPIGSPHGSKQVGSDDGTNYNCFSDTALQSCPDTGTKVSGSYQIPNTHPGDGGGWLDWTGDEDWVIFEPADNAAVFYFNEWFLEGGTSRNSSLQTSAASGRYYSITASDVNYLATAMHYGGDVNAQVHIWVTTGFNHSDYEENIDKDEHYGGRDLGGSGSGNWEDYDVVKSYINSRNAHYNKDVDDILTENGFLTYLARYRSGYDILVNTDDATRKRTGVYGVNHSIATIVLLYEKGVVDLRKYR